MVPAARLRRSSEMRFMFIVTSAHPNAPTPELMEAMHKLADREIKAGRMLDNGGLMPLATGAQVRITDGQLSVVDGLARMLRDVPLAEDLTQEALLAALEHWPEAGVPEKPGAWLMATAKRRALDHIRRVP